MDGNLDERTNYKQETIHLQTPNPWISANIDVWRQKTRIENV